MSLAVGAVLIFILLVPPLAFYACFSTGGFSKSGPKFSLLEGTLASAVFSLFIHAAALFFIHQQVRFDILIRLVGGELKDIHKDFSNAEFRHALKGFALYNFVLDILFALLGRFARYAVINLRLDNGLRYLFRLRNKWWYLFNGLEGDVGEFDLLFIDAVMDTKEGTMIYSGFLSNFVCEGEELDRIYLRAAVRRPLKTSKEDGTTADSLPGEPMTIPGQIFILPFKNCINLNLRFIIVQDDIQAINEMPVTENTEDLPPAT